MPPRNLAEARRLHPNLGFALYALEPRGAVTLEVLDGETSHTFVGVTEAEAWSAAFPGTAPDEPPEKRVDDLIHRGLVFRAVDKVEQPGERKAYDLGVQVEDEHPDWVLVPREPTDKMLSEPASMLPASYTLTECCDLFREMWKIALEYVPVRPIKPVNEPAPPAEPAHAPSVFD